MSITVNLNSDKEGELKRFLDYFYEKDSKLEEGIIQWIYVYNNPLEAIDIVSVLLDNNHLFDIKLFIKIDDCDLLEITNDNHDSFVKSIFYYYYDEKRLSF